MIWYDMVSIYRLFGNTQTKYGINLLSFFFFFLDFGCFFFTFTTTDDGECVGVYMYRPE